jgi:glycine cleavage system transcriptional repressor
MDALHHVVITAVGPDRPGLVDEVTDYILERGGNLEDSRMVNLHGQFAMMLLVAGDDEAMARLRDGLGSLKRQSGIHVELHDAGLPAAAPASPALPYRLSTWAMDHPGLVQSVAHLLRGLDINIESVDTALRPAPYTNAPLFEMELVISVPAATHIAELREALGDLCDELNIDWQLAAL